MCITIQMLPSYQEIFIGAEPELFNEGGQKKKTLIDITIVIHVHTVEINKHGNLIKQSWDKTLIKKINVKKLQVHTNMRFKK